MYKDSFVTITHTQKRKLISTANAVLSVKRQNDFKMRLIVSLIYSGLLKMFCPLVKITYVL